MAYAPIDDDGIRRVLAHMGADLATHEWATVLGHSKERISATLRSVHWDSLGWRQHQIMRMASRRSVTSTYLAVKCGMTARAIHAPLSKLRKLGMLDSERIPGSREHVYTITDLGRDVLAMA